MIMTPRSLHAALSVVCLVLVTVIAAEISFGAFGPDADEASPTDRSGPAEMPVLRDIDAMVAGILQRPLFSGSRLPLEEVVDIDEEGVAEPQPFLSRLTGVIIRPDGREALFERDGDRPIGVKEGGAIDGWTVKEIRLDRVVLSTADGDKVLQPTDAPQRPGRPKRVANATTAPNASAAKAATRGGAQGGSSQAQK
jgi:hypothetical protein